MHKCSEDYKQLFFLVYRAEKTKKRFLSSPEIKRTKGQDKGKNPNNKRLSAHIFHQLFSPA